MVVVFEDRTIDGHARAAKEINDYRLGKKTQYNQIVPLLNKVLATRNSEMLSALENAQAAIDRFSSRSAEQSHFIIAGLSDAKESIHMDIEELKPQLRQPEDTNLVTDRIVRMTRSFQRYPVPANSTGAGRASKHNEWAGSDVCELNPKRFQKRSPTDCRLVVAVSR